MSEKLTYAPSYAVPPGETLRETLEHIGMSQRELAARAGRPPKTINEIIRGKAAITPETALQLERVLGVPARLWLALERTYREAEARLAARTDLEAEAARGAHFPYAEMARLGWVPPTRDRVERAQHLLRFLGLASFACLEGAAAPVSYRVARCRQPSECALAAWLRKGELVAVESEAAGYSAARLQGLLPELRGMTRECSPGFATELTRRLATCGVTLVFVPHLPGTYAHGAARWLNPQRPLVQLSLRGKYADVFWFSLFHELGHVVLHGYRRDTIFISGAGESQAKEEHAADRFAADQLIPPTDYARFRRRQYYSRQDVVHFADHIGVAPGIAIGRLQHDKVLPHTHMNDLRVKLQWSGEVG